MSVFAVTGEFNGLAVAIFAVVLAVTLLITRWAATRTKTTTEFYTAGRGISGRKNGLAIAGDYLSASTFLGYAGLMFLFGFDGWIIGLAACMSFIVVLYLLAERMRNAGKFTLADVLSYRLKEKPARVAAASTSLLVTGIYLIAQLVGAGALVQALAGIDFAIAVLICGVFMTIYIVFGGMLATTWIQIIKAAMLMIAGVVIATWVLAKFSFSPSQLLDKAAAESGEGQEYLGPGLFLTSPVLVISTGLTIFFGTAGLPHILMRFFTVPDGKAARQSVVWTIGFIGVFTLIVTIIGFGARALMTGDGATEAVGDGRQPRGAAAGAVPRRRRGLRGRRHRARAVLGRGVRDDPGGRVGARARVGEHDRARPLRERDQERRGHRRDARGADRLDRPRDVRDRGDAARRLRLQRHACS